MDDDLLFGGQHQLSSSHSASPPSASQQDGGFRILWGNSNNSVLATYRLNQPNLPAQAPQQSMLAKIKRNSVHAGLASPTRPVASTSAMVVGSPSGAGSSSSKGNNSLGDTSGDTSTGSKTTASRLSKRRRRFQTSSSTPAIHFDTTEASINTTHSDRSLSMGDTNTEVAEMLGELARCIEADRKAAIERDRLATLKAKQIKASSAPAPQIAAIVLPPQSDHSALDVKGKQREKIAISPACSTVEEECMSQGIAGLALSTHEGQSAWRTSLSSKASNRAVCESDADFLDGSTLVETRSDKLELKSMARMQHVNDGNMATETGSHLPKGNAPMLQLPLQNKKLEDTLPAKREEPLMLASQSDQIPLLELEDEFWDENDKSLEMAMSQMDIPDAPSSQQGQKSASLETLKLGLPVPVPKPKPEEEKAMTNTWTGFKSRDKRAREKSSDSSSIASVGKLSSKPLVATRPNVQASTPTIPATTKAMPVVVISDTTAETGGAKGAGISSRALSQVSSNADKPFGTATTKPMNGTSITTTRAFGLSKSNSGASLTKKFKCPTILNTAAAKAEKERKAAATAKAASRIAQPLPAHEAWMEDLDWDESF